VGIVYSNPTPFATLNLLGFIGYADSSYADHEDCKSTSGYLFKIAGGPVSWRSRKQSITSTSSTEAEYVGYSIAAKEAIWLRAILLDLKQKTPDVSTTLIYGDNKPALSLTTNPAHHTRTKHISVPFHYAREQIQNGLIHMKYLPTLQMPADGLTKPLTGPSFVKFRKMLGLSAIHIAVDDTQSRGVSELLRPDRNLSGPRSHQAKCG
jgi:hypothetical protein